MPISKDKWNAGRNWEPLQVRILAFLKANQDKGFSVDELYIGLGYKKSSGFWALQAEIANLLDIKNTSETLVKKGIIKAKIIKETVGEITYYMAA